MTAAVVRTFVHERMADYAVPRHVRIVDEIPRNKTGTRRTCSEVCSPPSCRLSSTRSTADAPSSGGQNPPPPAHSRSADKLSYVIPTLLDRTCG